MEENFISNIKKADNEKEIYKIITKKEDSK